MILNVYAIRDKAVNAYAQPFYMHTDAEALRAFKSIANDKTTNISTQPSDYELFRIAQFDNIKGEFVNDYQRIACATETIEKSEIRIEESD